MPWHTGLCPQRMVKCPANTCNDHMLVGEVEQHLNTAPGHAVQMFKQLVALENAAVSQKVYMSLTMYMCIKWIYFFETPCY